MDAVQEFLKSILVGNLKLSEIKLQAYQLAMDLATSPVVIKKVLVCATYTGENSVEIDFQVFQQIKSEYEAGKWIPAIKQLHEATGWGLKESKDWVESRGWIRPTPQRNY